MTEEAAQASRRRFRRTLLIFGLAGPYIGLTIVLTGALILLTGFALAQGHDPVDAVAAVFLMGVFAALAAIPVGGLPGLLTGLAAARLQRGGVRGARYYAQCAAIGGLTTLIIPLVLRQGYEMWGAVGVATGLICAHLTRPA